MSLSGHQQKGLGTSMPCQTGAVVPQLVLVSHTLNLSIDQTKSSTVVENWTVVMLQARGPNYLDLS